MLGNVHKEVELVVEVIVDAIEKVVLFEAVTNATSATNLGISHVNAKKIKTYAIVAMALDILQKTANRLLENLIYSLYLIFLNIIFIMQRARIYDRYS